VPRGRNSVIGEQLAQVDNRDPFAAPVWRSPVYRTPEAVIMIVQLTRLIWRVLWFALTHPAVDAMAALIVATWLGLSWPGLAGLAVVAVTGLAGLRVIHPAWFARFVAVPVRDWLRWLFYRRRWKAAMTLAGLAPDYRGQPMLPVLYQVHRTGAVDLVRVGLVTGQAPTDFADKSENLAHAFGARLCRIRGAGPGVLVLELVRADTLVDPIPALPVTGEVDLTGLPVGRCEDGSPLAAAAGLHARADRGSHRVGEGLGDLVADPGVAARHRHGVGAGVGAGPQANGAILRAGTVPPVRLPDRRDGGAARGRGR
jgi:S-DNA-T family DNA segregation ATPase FtsK/SpoIIIE